MTAANLCARPTDMSRFANPPGVRGFWPLAVATAALAGCGSDDPSRKETVHVAGQVFIDGQPAPAPINVMCHDVKGLDKEHPTVSQAMTDNQGRFEISTYESGDGIPPGEYVLTFEWGAISLVSMQYGGPDKLEGRYSDPQKSPFRFQVESGKPLDLGRLELVSRD
jgi:5-hydroxyisourate hydrolase-like protein (transthyretin family)